MLHAGVEADREIVAWPGRYHGATFCTRDRLRASPDLSVLEPSGL